MADQRRQLLIATNNQDKLREIRQILAGSQWKAVGLDAVDPYPEPDETEDTLQGNALLKAREGFRRTGILTLADDSSLEVDALDGRPGVYSARYAGQKATYADNVNLLLNELSGVPDDRRTASFRCIMALVGPGVERCWEGVSEGMILTQHCGENGFGYDPVFWSPELGMTFAQASSSDKHRVSHRGRALEGLVEMLTDLE